jgi:amino acid transporter
MISQTSAQNTRKYTVRIVIGLLIITGGILADTFKISPPTAFQQPNPQDVDQMITVRTPFPEGFMIILGLALGATINFYSTYRYSEQTSDPTKSRGVYIMLGVILTLLTRVAAIYAYYT